MVVSESSSSAPQWDLSTIFPSLSSPEFVSALEDLGSAVQESSKFFDNSRIGTGVERAGFQDSTFVGATDRLNDLTQKSRKIRSYLMALISTDSKNDQALALASQVDTLAAQISKLRKSFTGWVGLAKEEEALSPALNDEYEFIIRKAKIQAEHQLDSEQENLVSDLELTGSVAWKKLYSSVTSQILVTAAFEGPEETISMSAVRNFAHHPNREVRERAYRAELTTWKQWEVPIAAALNSVKGETILLSSRRKWESPLEETLVGSNMDREILEAMLSSATKSFPMFRRYLRAKARALNLPRCGFFDLFAPISTEGEPIRWSWQEAEEFVHSCFAEYSPRLADLASTAFRKRWIDYPAKAGKQDGAYCMGVREGESRILMNFKPSFSAVSTLAHELGHAYHNLCLSDRTELQKSSPMTFAETASIFCETIVRRTAAKQGSKSERLAVLEASLQGSCQVVVDISSRYLFEKSVFEKRKQRELSPGEFCDLMTDAQKQTYGDGLDLALLHPYMWAAKPHYYGRTYYNFPYMFGLLFALGLYSVYVKSPEGFHERYDDLLSMTGLADADVLAQRFGIDLRDSEFWEGSLKQIESDIVEFEKLV